MLPDAQKSSVRWERWVGTFLLIHADPRGVPVFISSESYATSRSCACVFSKFVTNFLFGYGPRPEALLCFETRPFTEVQRLLSQGPCGGPFVLLPFADFGHVSLQTFSLGSAL